MIKPLNYVYRKLVEPHEEGYDLILAGTTALLLLGGVMVLFSASTPISDRMHGNSLIFLRNHLLHMMVGLGALWFAMRLPYGRWQQWLPLALLVMFVLLILVLIPGIGHQVGGARRWLRLGPVNVQPTEMLKLVLIMYVASYLNRKPGRVAQFLRGILPNFAVMGLFLALVVMQPDFGTMVLIALTLLLMIFVGGARPGHILYSLLGFCAIGTFLVFSQTYRMRRILAFLDPWSDRLDSGFQIVQSYLAFGSGGWSGVGLGDSSQKMFFLPDAHTDFIFSILGEELGFIGVVAALLLFSCFVWRGYRVALEAREDFGRYLAFGITTLLALQIVLNLAVVMGLMPTKGLPLPFFSFGGSSLVMSLLMVGILLNIGRRPTLAVQARRRRERQGAPPVTGPPAAAPETG